MGAAPITDFRERIFMKKAIQTAVLLVLCVAMTAATEERESFPTNM